MVRFTGGFTTAPVATTSTGNYMLYKGAFISESTLVPFPWGRWLIGAPLGQGYAVFQGPGTLSAEKGVFDFGVRLSDHVFDRAFDGKVNGTDAATFGNGRTLSIDEMADFTKQNRHLPTMKGRDDWRVERGFSLGDLTEQLWATTETQALYTTQLHDRLNVIELLSDSRPLTATELVEAKRAVAVMGDLTEGEKGALINDLAKRTVNANELR